MIKKRVDLLNIMLFVASPFLAIPSILYGVTQKSKFSLWLLIFTLGLVSYYYIPNFSDDKARYFEIYADFSNVSFIEMLTFFFISSQDFILQSLFYIASQLEIPAQLVFGVVTVITLSLIFKIYYDILDKSKIVSNKDSLLSLFLLILSISYLDLFSGIRFVFATAFIGYAYYQGLILQNQRKAYLYLGLACFTHFSTLTFIIGYFILRLSANKDYFFRIAFVLSLTFLLLPKGFLVDAFSSVGFSGALEEKGKAYIVEEDFIQSGINNGTFGSMVVHYVSILWLFSAYLYLLVTLKRLGPWRNIALFTATLINIFYSVPTIFFRYALIFKLVFTFLLIWELFKYKKTKYVYLFIGIFIMVNITQIIVTRNNLEKSFINSDNLFLLNIFTKPEITPNDFIY